MALTLFVEERHTRNFHTYCTLKYFIQTPDLKFEWQF